MTVAPIDILLLVLVCSVFWLQVNQWLSQRSQAKPTALERPATSRLAAADHAGDTTPIVLTGGAGDPSPLEIKVFAEIYQPIFSLIHDRAL